MILNRITLVAILGLAAALPLRLEAADHKVQKDFAKGRAIVLKVGSAPCQVGSSPDGRIHVEVAFTYDPSAYEPILEERGDTLELGERFSGNSHGRSRWTLSIPDGLRFEFRSGSGDLSLDGPRVELRASSGSGDVSLRHLKGEATLASGSGTHKVEACEGLALTSRTGSGDHELKGLKGQVDIRSGSGDLKASDLEGDVKVSVGSGDISLHGLKGNLGASSGSGSIRAEGLVLAEQGSISSGSGDVDVDLPRGEGYRLSLSTGSGNAHIHLRGQAPVGAFEFTVPKGQGSIVSVEPFDKEEEIAGSGDSHPMLRKSFKRGTSRNQITVRTGSGRAELSR